MKETEKYFININYHINIIDMHGRAEMLRQAVRSVKGHDKWQMGGRIVMLRKRSENIKNT